MRKSEISLLDKAKGFRPGSGYEVSAGAAFEVAQMYDNNLIKGFSTIYAMGFIKGQNAAKNKARRAAK